MSDVLQANSIFEELELFARLKRKLVALEDPRNRPFTMGVRLGHQQKDWDYLVNRVEHISLSNLIDQILLVASESTGFLNKDIFKEINGNQNRCLEESYRISYELWGFRLSLFEKVKLLIEERVGRVINDTTCLLCSIKVASIYYAQKDKGQVKDINDETYDRKQLVWKSNLLRKGEFKSPRIIGVTPQIRSTYGGQTLDARYIAKTIRVENNCHTKIINFALEVTVRYPWLIDERAIAAIKMIRKTKGQQLLENPTYNIIVERNKTGEMIDRINEILEKEHGTKLKTVHKTIKLAIHCAAKYLRGHGYDENGEYNMKVQAYNAG